MSLQQEPVHRTSPTGFFWTQVFPQKASPEPKRGALGRFRIMSNLCGDIRIWKWIPSTFDNEELYFFKNQTNTHVVKTTGSCDSPELLAPGTWYYCFFQTSSPRHRYLLPWNIQNMSNCVVIPVTVPITKQIHLLGTGICSQIFLSQLFLGLRVESLRENLTKFEIVLGPLKHDQDKHFGERKKLSLKILWNCPLNRYLPIVWDLELFT